MDDRHPAAGEPAWHVLYRFLWPFQYFRDVTRGDRAQQQSSYRHNRAMRFCLPGFMLKWSALSAHWFAWGSFLDSTLGFALLVVVLLGVDWLWLGRFADRF